MWAQTSVVVCIAVFLSACENNKPDTDATEAAVTSVTYHEHVAPLLNEYCVVCHTAGGIAPFALDSYAAAAAKADAIARSTEQRVMPPWLADNSGACNTFEHARWLSDADIAAIGNWAAQGAVAGTPPATPLTPSNPPRLAPQEISATADMGADYTPSGSAEYADDDYRCFIVDPGVTATRYLTAYQVNPGNPGVVHHVLLFSLPDAEAELQAANKDAADAGLGYQCFGDAGVTDGAGDDVPFVAGWAPGLPVTAFPTGTGIRLPAGRKLIMQVHYNLLAGSGADRTSVDLKLAESVEQEALMAPVADVDMVLPPGQADVSTAVTFGPLPRLTIHGVFPHMHLLGKSLKVEKLSTSGDRSCVVDVPRWDFHWQQFFFYSTPIDVNTGESVRLTCTYDTSGRTSEVRWGEGTQDEMCVNFFYLTNR